MLPWRRGTLLLLGYIAIYWVSRNGLNILLLNWNITANSLCVFNLLIVLFGAIKIRGPWTSSMDLVHKGLHGPGFMFCTFPFPRASKILERKLEFNLIRGKYSCWMIAWNLLHLLSILIRGRKLDWISEVLDCVTDYGEPFRTVSKQMFSSGKRPQEQMKNYSLYKRRSYYFSYLKIRYHVFYQSFSAISNSINFNQVNCRWTVHKFVSVRKTNEFSCRIKWTKRHAVKKIGPFGIHMLVLNISDPFLQGRQKSIHKV